MDKTRKIRIKEARQPAGHRGKNMNNVAIETVAMGEYVKLVDKKGNIGKRVWVVDGYCRSNKGYMLTAFNDHCCEKKLAKGALVNVGFDF